MVGFGKIVAGVALVGAGLAGPGAPAYAAGGSAAAGHQKAQRAGSAPMVAVSGGAATLGTLVAYVKSGNVFVSQGATERALTRGGGDARPRWSPDGKRIAFIHNGQLWEMNADGSAQRMLTTRPAAGPSWSPDGKEIAFSSLSCEGGPGVFEVASAGVAQPKVLFPQDCRTEALPAEQTPAPRTAGTLTQRLSTDDAVAWSPDGKQIAFRGGDCDSVYDSCLSIGAVGSGAERCVAAYGGGSLEDKGFAVVPNWRGDGAKLTWTESRVGETAADNEPVHVVEFDPASGAKRNVGTTMDREMAYLDATHGVVTGQYAGGSYVVIVGLANNSRIVFHQGSQPSVQPHV